MSVHTMDLGVAEVHAPGVAQVGPQLGAKTEPDGNSAPATPSGPTGAKQRRAKRRAAKKTNAAKQTRGPRSGMRVTLDHPVHGRLEVRQMHKGTACQSADVYACSGVLIDVVTLSTAANDSDVVWNQLAVAGEYHGHQNGSFRFDRSVFERIIANFQRNPDNTRPDGGVVVDWEHASEADPAKLADGGAPAAGFIRALAIRGNELWAAIKWLPKAREQVKTGQYKRISPAVAFKSADPKTGEEIGPELRSAGLTNGPFLQGMQPLAARRDGGASVSLSRLGTDPMGTIRAALQAHPTATLDQLSSHLEGLREMVARSAGQPIVDGYDLSAPMGSLRTMANVPITTSDEDLLDLVEDLIDEAIEELEERLGAHADADDAQMSREAPAGAAETAAPQIPERKETPMANDDVVTLTNRVKTLEAEKSELSTVGVKALENEAAAVALTQKAHAELSVVRAKSLESEATALTLSHKVTDLEKQMAALKVELSTARKSVEERDAIDVERDVDQAIVDHGAKNAFLCKDNRDVLVTLRRTSPEAFSKLAPKLKADERVLLSRQVPEREKNERSSLLGGHARIATAVELSHKLIKDEPAKYGAMDFEDVRDIAAEILQNNPLGIAV